MLKRNVFINMVRLSGFFEHFIFVEKVFDVTDCPSEKFYFQMGDSD